MTGFDGIVCRICKGSYKCNSRQSSAEVCGAVGLFTFIVFVLCLGHFWVILEED